MLMCFSYSTFLIYSMRTMYSHHVDDIDTYPEHK